MHYQDYPGSSFPNYGVANNQGVPAYAEWPHNVHGGKHSAGYTPYITGGNICAYAPDQPVYYTKVNINHWPSQDYHVPHPKGFLHTLHQKQYLGEYVPYK